jgi:hypothetical protein
MTGLLQKIMLICLVLAIGACAALVPNKYLITKERLVVAVQKRFPLHKKNSNGLYNVALGIPQITLIPELNRVQFEGELSGSAIVFGLDGHYVFSSELQYDSGRHAIFLHEARFDSLQLVKGNDYEDVMLSLINQMVKESAKNDPVYSIKPDELVVFGEKVDVTGIEVIPEGILLKIKALH